jgi:hypothetical protein
MTKQQILAVPALVLTMLAADASGVVRASLTQEEEQIRWNLYGSS